MGCEPNPLEHFQAKWIQVRVKKMRPNKETGRVAMRSTALFFLLCLATALPSAAYAKKPKPDTPDDKLNCKQISGRMQVHILQLRGFDNQKQASNLSRSIQSGMAATFGNQSHGVDPQGQHDADIQALQAYNQRLVALGCKSYDLQKELSVTDPHETPAPTIPAPKKKKAPAAASPPAPATTKPVP
ncbi:hypothetical protein [Hyphomicrobium sp.]|uniref:hypothetical protein n=1 Tax=Hyphomicrobium sp. TaxID=82 RepID=UPI000FC38DF5|nr:hypothetical protein [Hyphomicrobium sp.]RUP09122.1 MAG: hypothetical protein EKK38_10815 [Hyphomicrobium sp.]